MNAFEHGKTRRDFVLAASAGAGLWLSGCAGKRSKGESEEDESRGGGPEKSPPMNI